MAAPNTLNIPEAPRPGDEVGIYRLLDELGTGGMGKVFLAEHRKLGRRVALKILQPELWHNRRSVQRFFQEARLVNRIDHEHIVEIYDYVQEADGLSYLIMELLVGHDLTQSREQFGTFALARSLPILKDIAGALAAAHSQGVVHRDLKPANVFLVQKGSRRDFVKLLDFGIAKLQDAVNLEGPHTRTGAIVGTPLYMSPEQASGEKIDARSDLYSLGVVAYWMLADSFPYKAKSFAELLSLQQSQRPNDLPTTTAWGDPIPPQVAELVLRCLEREAQARYQSAQELEAILGRLIDELGLEPAPAPVRIAPHPRAAEKQPPAAGETKVMTQAVAPRPKKKPLDRRPAVVAAIVSALLAGGGYALWLRSVHPSPPAPEVVGTVAVPVPVLAPIAAPAAVALPAPAPVAHPEPAPSRVEPPMPSASPAKPSSEKRARPPSQIHEKPSKTKALAKPAGHTPTGDDDVLDPFQR